MACWVSVHSYHHKGAATAAAAAAVAIMAAYLLEEVPAGVGVARVAWLLESAQGIRDERGVRVLEPLLMGGLRGSARDGLETLHGIHRLHTHTHTANIHTRSPQHQLHLYRYNCVWAGDANQGTDRLCASEDIV